MTSSACTSPPPSSPDDFGRQPPTPAEQAYLDARAAYDVSDQGYSEIMCTRPDTIAAALADSPAGLLAWIVDKYRDWSDCEGDLDEALGQGHSADRGDAVLGHWHHRFFVPPVLQLRPHEPRPADRRARGGHAQRRAGLRHLPEEPGRAPSSPICGTGTPRIAAGTSWPTRSRTRSPVNCGHSSGRCDRDPDRSGNPHRGLGRRSGAAVDAFRHHPDFVRGAGGQPGERDAR